MSRIDLSRYTVRGRKIFVEGVVQYTYKVYEENGVYVGYFRKDGDILVQHLPSAILHELTNRFSVSVGELYDGFIAVSNTPKSVAFYVVEDDAGVIKAFFNKRVAEQYVAEFCGELEYTRIIKMEVE